MPTKTFEITEYKYGFFNAVELHDKRILAHLYQKNNLIGIVHFQEKIQAPHIDNRGLMYLYYPIADLHNIIDMLRNEKPIFLHFDEHPTHIQAFLSTSKEPVGKGETKS